MSIVSIRRFVVALCCAGLVGGAGFGCGVAPSSTAAHAPSSLPTAQRMYAIGEQRFAAGRADQAVELWKHAILQLPVSSDYDELRHRLILRRAYGQLVAHDQTSERAYLEDGRQMLSRYIARHESLFGEGAKAKAERGPVYEILYEFESRLDRPEPLPEPTDAIASTSGVPTTAPPHAQQVAQRAPDSDLATVGVYNSRTVRAPGIAASTRQLVAGTRHDTQFGPNRPWREGEVRVVHVDTRGRPTVDDPATRDALRSWGTEPGPWLTTPMIQEFIPPRPYVRVGGLARRVEGDDTRLGGQGLATAVVRNVRQQLRSCYDEAFAREPDAIAVATVEFDVLPDGSIGRPSIVAGEVVDPIGDACVLDQLALAHVDVDRMRPTAAAGVRLRVPLTFFYDGAVYMDEAGGRAITTGMQTGLPASEGVPRAPRGCAMQGSCPEPVPTR